MRYNLYIISIIFSILALISCADTTSSDETEAVKLGEVEFLKTDGANLDISDTGFSGTGKVMAKLPLESIKSGINFHLVGAIEDNGQLRLTTFSDDKLENGLAFELSRSGDTLGVKILAEGKESDITDYFTAIKASEEISLFIDVHNNETPAHILIWKGDVTTFSEENVLFNSEADHDHHEEEGHGEEEEGHKEGHDDETHDEEVTSPGNGSGTVWGVELTKASITKDFVSGEEKFSEE